MLINVGDVIQNWEGVDVLVESLEEGRYGILVKGSFVQGGRFSTYLIPELPPCESAWPGKLSWYNWANRATITLANGIKVGNVCLSGFTLINAEAYDLLWEETIRLMEA